MNWTIKLAFLSKIMTWNTFDLWNTFETLLIFQIFETLLIFP